jgi:RNA polymerase sigma-70 factor (ECF subfamily)
MDFDKQLIELQRERERAQQLFFERYGKTMYALCRRYLSPAEEAEEAMMNGFLKVFKKVKDATFSNELAFAGWMRRIMVNECLQQLRKSHSFLIMADADEVEKADSITQELTLDAKELFTLIDGLPAGYRTVFNLYVIEGYTHKEIAELMQISEGASKSQLSKARAKLAHLWKQKNEFYGLGKAR